MVQWAPWCYRKALIYPTVKSHRLLQTGSCAVELDSAGFKRSLSPVFPRICSTLAIRQMLSASNAGRRTGPTFFFPSASPGVRVSVCAGCSRTKACGTTSGGCPGWLREGRSGTLRWQHQFNIFVRPWCETLVLSSHIRLARAKPFSHRVFYLPRDWKAIIVLTSLVDMSIQNPPCIYFNRKQTCHRNVMVVAI